MMRFGLQLRGRRHVVRAEDRGREEWIITVAFTLSRISLFYFLRSEISLMGLKGQRSHLWCTAGCKGRIGNNELTRRQRVGLSHLCISWDCLASCRASPAYSQSFPPRTLRTRRSCGCLTASGSWSSDRTLWSRREEGFTLTRLVFSPRSVLLPVSPSTDALLGRMVTAPSATRSCCTTGEILEPQLSEPTHRKWPVRLWRFAASSIRLKVTWWDRAVTLYIDSMFYAGIMFDWQKRTNKVQLSESGHKLHLGAGGALLWWDASKVFLLRILLCRSFYYYLTYPCVSFNNVLVNKC